MRDQFQAELAEISSTLVRMAEGVTAAMRRATTALLDADQSLAEDVIADDAKIDVLYRVVEDQVFEVLARPDVIACRRRSGADG